MAPNHLMRKYSSAPLSPSLKAEYGTRTMSLIKGDTVSITKGDRKLSEGKVIKVNPDSKTVLIEGVTRTRMDGSNVQIPIKANNVIITNLNLEDDWRKKILERRTFSSIEG
jgi:large subunit ribosomal protein L24